MQPNTVKNLLTDLKNPMKEMGLIRNGLKTNVIDSFLTQENLSIKDVLEKLNIPASTYFAKKKNHKPLDSAATEKFLRLISILTKATELFGKAEGQNWLYRKIPSLNNQIPIDLLDTEIGHRLVEQALLQIKYGIYG